MLALAFLFLLFELVLGRSLPQPDYGFQGNHTSIVNVSCQPSILFS